MGMIRIKKALQKNAVVLVAALLLVMPISNFAAEVRGVIRFTQMHNQHERPQSHYVSVVLTPLQGQKISKRTPKAHRMYLRNRAVTPLFLTIAKGDRVYFRNSDMRFQYIGLFREKQKQNLQIAPRGQKGDVKSLMFNHAGTWYLFGLVDGKQFGRIDVVENAYFQEFDAPGEFAFRDIETGKWRLQVKRLDGSRYSAELDVNQTTPIRIIRLSEPTEPSGKNIPVTIINNEVRKLYPQH
jgi:hypothetical protein